MCFFHDCGIGKTYTAIKLIQYAMQFVPNCKTLIVCRIGIIEDAWISDLNQFAPEIDYIVFWDKNQKKRRPKLAEDHDLYMTTPEQYKILFEDIKKKKFNIIFVDESSMMKSYKSQITKALLSLAGVSCKEYPSNATDIVPFRYCLSATPAPNNESEYWAQITFVAPKIFAEENRCGRIVPSFFSFRSRFFNMIPLGGQLKKLVFRKRMLKQFTELMAPVVDIVRKEEAIDLPPVINVTRKISLTKKEMDAYNSMKKDLVIKLESGNVVIAEFILTCQQKLRQLSCGFVYNEDETHIFGTSKIKAVVEILDHLEGRQVVIWSNWVHIIEQLSIELGDSAVALRGGQEERHKAIDAFKDKKNEKVKYIIINPMSGAHGLNFQYNASEAIWVNPDWSWELTSQSRDRLPRIGQKNKVTNYVIVSRDTIEEQVVGKTLSKQQMCNLIYKHLKSEL